MTRLRKAHWGMIEVLILRARENCDDDDWLDLYDQILAYIKATGKD